MSQSDNLRDRIICALLPLRCDLEEPCEECRILACQDADAVIAALGITAECDQGRDDQWLDGTIWVNANAPGTPVAVEQDPGSVIYVTANYARKMAGALLAAADKSDKGNVRMSVGSVRAFPSSLSAVMPRWSHVPCGSCGAAVGEPCRSVSGRVTDAHTPRMRAWWEQAERSND